MDNETKEKTEKQNNKILKIVMLILIVVIIAVSLIFKNHIVYQIAENEFNNKNYNQAIDLYELIEDFKNSKEMITESNYQIALDKITTDRIGAITKFEELGDYKDSKEKILEIKQSILEDAKIEIKNKNFEKAQKYLNSIKTFKGVKTIQKELYYQKAIYLHNNKNYVEAKKYFENVKNYKKTKKYLSKTIYGLLGNRYNFSQVSATYGISWTFSFSDKLSSDTIEVPSKNITNSEYYYYLEGNTLYCSTDNSQYRKLMTLHSIKKTGNKIVSFSNGTNIVWKILEE